MNSSKRSEEIKSQIWELVKQTPQEAYEAEIEVFVDYPKRKPPKGAGYKTSNKRNRYIIGRRKCRRCS